MPEDQQSLNQSYKGMRAWVLAFLKACRDGVLSTIIFLWEQGWTAMALVAGAAVACIVAARLFGADLLYFVPVIAKPEMSAATAGSLNNVLWLRDIDEIRACIHEAREANRPYVLLAVMDNVQFELTKGSDKLHAKQRITYVLLPLRDIGQEEATFHEQYQVTAGRGTQTRWYGPFEEHDAFEPFAYDVKFGAKQGELLTVITGNEADYTFPFQPINKPDITLGKDEDFWDYNNAENDVICQLTMLVESSSYLLSPKQVKHLHRASEGAKPSSTDATRIPAATNGPGQSLSAFLGKWTNVVGADSGVITYGLKKIP